MDVRGKLVELLEELCIDYGATAIFFTSGEAEVLADHLIANGVTINIGTADTPVADNLSPTEPLTHCQQWIPASEPPDEYRDEYGELIPFLVCLEGTDYPFRAMYDGKVWGDGWGAIPVTYWMPLPEPPKGE